MLGEVGSQSYQIQPTEKPLRSTMVTYINPLGDALPPLVIHRGRFCDGWLKDAPEGMYT